jgi:MFS transporter, MFS domain-containing protein family, molybdate-anion transporter
MHQVFTGIAMSLYFSACEGWFLSALIDSNLNKHYMNRSITWAKYCTQIAAVVSGLTANVLTSFLHQLVPISLLYPIPFYLDPLSTGGYTIPFTAAVIASIICFVSACAMWEENSTSSNALGGNRSSEQKQQHNTDLEDSRQKDIAISAYIAPMDVYLSSVVTCLFEGSMYTFFFMWTPALNDYFGGMPLGIMFSSFMVSYMVGSTIFNSIQIHQNNNKANVEKLAVYVLLVAALSMFLTSSYDYAESTIKFLAMNAFAMTIGMYLPIINIMKTSIVTSLKRPALYNLFRIPLIIIVWLQVLSDLQPSQSFMINGLMLSAASGLQYWLLKRQGIHDISSVFE